jgi:3-phosphoglycerate kinase
MLAITPMANMFASSVIDHVFIGGVMANMFHSSVVDHVFIGGVEANMLTITPPMNT